MRILLGLFLLMTACGHRQFTKLHFVAFDHSNQGRALPVLVIPVDDELRRELERKSPEDLAIDEEIENLMGFESLTLKMPDTKDLVVERKDNRKDFLIVVDFADVVSPEQQKVFLGKQHQRAKDLYVLAEGDRLRLIGKKDFRQKLERVKRAKKDYSDTKKELKDLTRFP